MANVKELTDFGKKLAIKAIELGLTNKELADKLETSPMTLAKIMTGRTTPGQATMEKLHTELGFDASDLASYTLVEVAAREMAASMMPFALMEKERKITKEEYKDLIKQAFMKATGIVAKSRREETDNV